MNYQLLINDSEVIQGNLFSIGLGLALLVVVIICALVLLIRKLRENEVLKYEFITIIAHKFHTPLTHIKWLSEGLLADTQDARVKESLLDIQKANQGLVSLTGTLVELTDAEDTTKSSYTFESLALCEMVQGIAESVRSEFTTKNIFFSVSCANPEVHVSVDRTRMSFVFQTLLQNACAYTKTGGKVDVTIGISNGKAAVLVADNGIGIDSSDIPRLFSKFYRTKIAQETDTEGFGVALYLSRSIVNRHHGKIEVFSEGLNKGSTFTVLLPIAD